MTLRSLITKPDLSLGEKLGSTTVSAVTSLDIGAGLDLDVTFNDLYQYYKIMWCDVRGSATSKFAVRAFLNEVISDGGSDYRYTVSGSRSHLDGSYTFRDSADSEIQLSGGLNLGTQGARSMAGELIIERPTETGVYKTFRWNAGMNNDISIELNGFGHNLDVTDNNITGLRFLMLSGTLNGEFSVYGYR